MTTTNSHAGPTPATLRPDAMPNVELLPDGTAIARFENIATLHFRDPSGRPKVLDLDLAEVLGFLRPRKIRDLIRRMEKAGKLRGVDWRPTVGRQSTGHGGTREFMTREAYLTREQSLLVAAQSNTPRAWALTELMARTFDAVIECAAPAVEPALSSDAIAALVAQLVAQQLAANTPTLGADAETEVLARVQRLAAMRTGDQATRRELARCRSAIHVRLRNLLYWRGSWRHFPRVRVGELRTALDHEHIEAVRVAAAIGRARQLPLRFDASPSP